MNKLILASNSPRRRELFQYLEIPYEVDAADVDEVVDEFLPHEEAVMELAYQKAAAVFQRHKEEMVLGFDTLVMLDDKLLGKPKSEEEAKEMLRALSGKTHIVYTGCALISKKYSKSFYEATRVTFCHLTDKEIDQYVATKEPMDKAGAYAIQGKGSKFVCRVNGDYFTVMGLPISRIWRELKEMGWIGETQ